MGIRIVDRAHARWLLALALAGFGACAEPTSPDHTPKADTPSPDQARIPVRAGHGLDAEFSRLASQIPGFGGMYYDSSGKLNMYVKPPAPGVRQAPVDVVQQLRALGSPRVQSRVSQTAAVTTLAAKYDFLQLQAYKAKLRAVFAVKGVVYTDIDESENRVRIAITPVASQAAVERVLGNAGVPREAVIISRLSAVDRVKTLTQRFRPIPAGVGIAFPLRRSTPGFGGTCSLGFNARLESRPEESFFVTASHCSDIQGGNDRTRYFQPFEDTAHPSDRIAIEFKDPRYGDLGGLCIYDNARCRFSDALLARYRSSDLPELGKIARTTFGLRRVGSLIIDKNHPRWDIIGELEFPFLGETVHKVGRASGWTFGRVVATCIDVGPKESDIVLLCQDMALSGARSGDSGAGIFERADATSSDVFLTGVLWGAGTSGDGAPAYFFSSMENIEFELGPLTTTVCTLSTRADADRDRLPDCVETNTRVFRSTLDTGTDPNNADTDGDGIRDGDEVLGTVQGLDLPVMGVSPLRKDILIEYDWFDDLLQSEKCDPHSHRPTPAAVAMVAASFAKAPLVNPDGSTGINIIQDYGQGGVSTGGNLIADLDGVLAGEIVDPEFRNYKRANFNSNRNGYFHYTILAHYYDTNSLSTGIAERPGDDLIVAMHCPKPDLFLASTIMHELGHNLNLSHAGAEDLPNFKPNYNSIMNYKYQFPGIDNNCTPPGDGVLDYSIGARPALAESNLSEAQGVCGNPPGPGWDWNGDGDALDTGLAFDINVDDDGSGDGILGTLSDYNDWAHLFLGGISDANAALLVRKEIIRCMAPLPLAWR